MDGMDNNPDNTYFYKRKGGPMSSAIMQSVDSTSVSDASLGYPSFQSNVSLYGVSSLLSGNKDLSKLSHVRQSFQLVNDSEFLMVSSPEQFVHKLHCTSQNLKVKVISIFGNTGDGKSHTLNHTFFDGFEIFHTSNEQISCTFGVWAAFDHKLKAILLDTEGLLGISLHENARTRLLLKVLAVSDIIIYRTRAERLSADMITFLGSASRAYSHYFKASLEAVSKRERLPSTSSLGPSVIIFHETQNTIPLSNNKSRSPEDQIRKYFAKYKLEIDAFSSIKYVGIKSSNQPTDFQPLRMAIENELNNTTVRSAKKPHLVYNTLKILNDKFSGKIERNAETVLFPDQYFTCPVKCHSCGCRCQNSMGHGHEGQPHSSDTKCKYQHQFENMVSICKRCYQNGEEILVTSQIQSQSDGWLGLAKYAWLGFVIECPRCGEIYRSRKHWYGNKDPEDSTVRNEITHVWTVTDPSMLAQNTAQRVVDNVAYISDAVASVSLQPTKALSAWVADQVAPAYWRPNHEILHCHKCRRVFSPTDTKHHCRSCGEGFCDKCSSKTKHVPSRNWHTPVRVCDSCYNDRKNEVYPDDAVSPDVSVRKVSEQVVSTLSTVGTVLTYSKSLIKDIARPSYWVPDPEIVHCCVCQKRFCDTLPLHHCRDCGRGVCQDCSPHREPVPRRGWSTPVRVCDICNKRDYSA